METLNRDITPIRMRNYGRIIQNMIQVASEEENQEERRRMILYIALCMRQKNMIWNKDLDSGIQRIREDIKTLSNGHLSCDFPEFETELQKQPIVNKPQKKQNNQNNQNNR